MGPIEEEILSTQELMEKYDTTDYFFGYELQDVVMPPPSNRG